MFKYNRNPNYLGMMLLYLSFAIVSGKNLAYGMLIFIWLFLFYAFMKDKDVSLEKKKGWNEYKKHSYLFLWKIHSNDLVNYALYGLLISFLIWNY